MTLASIAFAYPLLLLVGLLAAGIPVLLHLLNRIRSPIVPFPTLRFLKITAQKTSRRRQLQQWILLMLRMMVFALLGMAVAGPVIGGGNLALAYGMILLLLLGVGLSALAGVLVVSALDAAKARGGPASSEELVAQTKAQSAEAKQRAIAPPRRGRYWSLSALAAILALVLAGYAVFALGSNRYFTHGGGEYSGRSTACVIILDNSHSMLARQDSTTRLNRAKQHVRQLLADVLRPAEMALLVTNPNPTAPAPTLTVDSTAIIGQLDSLETLGRAQPLKERIQTAVTLLNQSTQPNKLLLILSDFAGAAYSDVEMFSALAGAKNLQVAFMPEVTGNTTDLGLARFAVSGGQPVVGAEISFEADIVNNSDAADVAEAEFLVDDKPVPGVTPRAQVGTGRQGRATVKFTHRLGQSGYHKYTLKLKDDAGALDWDNQRSLVLSVNHQIRVLLIGQEARPRYRSAAYFAQAALAPYEGLKTPTGQPSTWSIEPSYLPVGRVDPGALRRYAAVFLCDVPRISPELADGLVQYARQGGRVVLQLGPGIEAAAYNRELGPRHLLPGLLARPLVTAGGSPVDFVDTSTEVFANLYDTLEPFQRVVVTGRWQLSGDRPERGQVLWKLADGSPAITRHPLGAGEVYSMLTVPSADWSNFATQPAYLAAMNRMAQGELGNLRRATSSETGQSLLINVPSEDRKLRLNVTTPDGRTFAVDPVLADRPHWPFSRTHKAGLYTWESADGPPASLKGMFVVNPPADEVELAPTDVEALKATVKTDDPAIIARVPADLLKELRKEDRSLMPGVLALVMILAVLEALLANRYKPAVRTAAPAATPSASPALGAAA